MFFEELEEYRDIIHSKLNGLERKFKLSYTTHKDKDQLIELGKNLHIVRKALEKLEQNNLSWDELKILGINKSSLKKTVIARTSVTKTQLSDFSLLSTIPIIEIIQTNASNSRNQLNIMYSIIEYINIHYQTLFTQKSLLSSAKTSMIREQIYLQHQEILHIFNNYTGLLVLSAGKSIHDMERLLNKEFVILLKKIYTFLTGINDYINMIQQDSTFTVEDFQQLVKSTDKDSVISGLTLEIALKECQGFISEALEYIIMINKDIFDAMNIAENDL